MALLDRARRIKTGVDVQFSRQSFEFLYSFPGQTDAERLIFLSTAVRPLARYKYFFDTRTFSARLDTHHHLIDSTLEVVDIYECGDIEKTKKVANILLYRWFFVHRTDSRPHRRTGENAGEHLDQQRQCIAFGASHC